MGVMHMDVDKVSDMVVNMGLTWYLARWLLEFPQNAKNRRKC